MKRYSPTRMGSVRRLLDGLDHNMKVEIGPGVPLVARTVAALRALSIWPPALVLEVPPKPSADGVVKIELRR
jgi:hypothetical protein